jgi:formylglycine-generating enzyme required for sulfatase activity
MQCNGLEQRTCGEDGKWQEPVKCQSRCDRGGCVPAPSCERLDNCAGELSCCDSVQVGPASFQLSYAVAERVEDKLEYHVRRVSRSIRPLALDRFEVTVGRFHNFVDAYETARSPGAGAGKHPAFPDSGWQPQWSDENGPMPLTIGELSSALRARGESLDLEADQTLPVRGVSWHLAFAFCIWDGGRLPTEAEWAYAADSGEDRVYPWLSDPEPSITHERAVYSGEDTMPVGPAPVGTHSSGKGPLGHEDLAGNVYEWMADVYTATLPATCHGPQDATVDELECLQRGAADADRVLRGGSYEDIARWLQNVRRSYQNPAEAKGAYGIRCARDLAATH